ncbi:MAG TPA: magnesium transporter [Mariniphaga anaerophila]|uniref:Magnesium transporter MgtE n=1 Tax=Mariniphaga anaerophila TaxID=1484053 RepID=A0A831LMP5_9BACT|nr:magnesium transporter [Mariniphaga anaerophila]
MEEVMISIRELLELIDNRQWKELRQELEKLDPAEIAEIIEDLKREGDDIILFRLLPRETAKETFFRLEYDKQEELLEGLADRKHLLAELLNDLAPDDRTALFEELPGPVTQRLIQLLSPEERKISIQLLGYPEDSIGRLMTPDYVAVKPEMTIEQALDHIRQFGKDSETLNVVYVVDKNWKLIDEIRLREILLAKSGQTIEDLMDNRFVALNVLDDQETVINIFHDYDRVALPVINTEGILLGIVTFDDVMDVEEEEATEDFHKFGSIQDLIFNPARAKVFLLYKKRIVWLVILVFMNVFSGAAIAGFEDTIQAMVSLVFFLPLLIDSGGNAGAQSATLMIRALATGDVITKDWLRLLGKELMVALLLGLTMAIAVSLVASFRAPEIITVVGLSMMCTVLAGSLIGLSLPFIFTILKQDPATASAPLITSLADISGVLIYFSIATWYLGI